MTFHSLGAQQRSIIHALYALSGLGILFSGLRLYAIQQRTIKLLHWDALWIILSLVFALAFDVPVLVGVSHGLGRHLVDLTYGQITEVAKCTLIAVSLAAAACFFGKCAIVALLLEVQGPLIVYRRYLLHAITTVFAISTIAMVVACWVQCTPVAKIWNILLPGTCSAGGLYTVDLTILNGAINVFVDIFLSLYPITVIWKLQLKSTTKVAICFLMAGGMAAAVASIFRTLSSAKVRHDRADITYVFGPLILYALIEVWLVIILGSLPALRPLFQKWFTAKDASINSNTLLLSALTTTCGDGSIGVHGNEVDMSCRTTSHSGEKTELSAPRSMC